MERNRCALLIVLAVLAMPGGGNADDKDVLMAFKASADVSNRLTSWGNGDPCSGNWTGVKCVQGRIRYLILEGLELAGSMQALTALQDLRIVSLKGNSLNGTLPDLTNWRYLWSLYLHHNNFSGELPPSLSNLVHLWRLNLSFNGFSGQIPPWINSSRRLLTLRLENNQFSGAIPDLRLVNLTEFNVANNRLSGEIPPSLRNFSGTAFLGNPFLCGGPLAACTVIPATPAPSPAVENIIPATPTSRPNEGRRTRSRLGTGAIIAIVVGDAAVLALIALVFLFFYWKRYQHMAVPSPKTIDEKTDFPASQYSAQVPEAERSKLVFVDSKAVGFDLEDLLRASAEMLGKGSFGTAYKAVLEDGTIVAVKRLKDITISGRKEFEQHMELIAKFRHPNVVKLIAYYYAKEEKLLVYDFMPNGNLYTLLHGNRGPGRKPLDWTTRVKIALGAAKGLAFIHRQPGAQKIPHGNIKSSNVLLDKDGNACIADFGLALLMNTAAASRLVGYRAPEHAESKKISFKGDVYSFGVLLLELLTGKAPAQSHTTQGENIDLPRWVQSVVREEWTAEVFDIELMKYKNIEEEMVAMLQVGMVCVSQSPDDRPKMSQVVKMIEDIRADQSPVAGDSTSQSRSGSPSDASH
ncbi:probable leucine-rich repeat receptor-like protein kinase At1g68400 [Selaginella moellendorffii]|nr:probable leucine-rich repeat receptor-like protein kinase At1g68400 [Selaginella moellendorffii]XP_024545115.1 probable leucine-rich repeat receptor-like protein kinase At1g68400 [Selaginella moellendorffii]XP_024545116.1 probable leucine-rich repeat receptor-like protein kinase At1g68400 [Selaginella moellendorffii]|eukprot:XP_002984179.2 probable leucine-rich repeat receptor-like protein kinase At1g68400 [Selaginella moellendorffii]